MYVDGGTTPPTDQINSSRLHKYNMVCATVITLPTGGIVFAWLSHLCTSLNSMHDPRKYRRKITKYWHMRIWYVRCVDLENGSRNKTLKRTPKKETVNT